MVTKHYKCLSFRDSRGCSRCQTVTTINTTSSYRTIRILRTTCAALQGGESRELREEEDGKGLEQC
ncbi:hypothetical protein OCU04_013036 [Sclerotinia nivalis]|uniref:Uncharacterized protein n=1 Tax=Sclerotinia nivalis TaxID=352851 RepID=A0A9X0A7V5_9HELO|nr:hypothetical protein OCU04_013036 [Sclerotinia nivalis]